VKLKGQVALITGASRGVGRATAQALAGLGCDIVINFQKSAEEADETVGLVRDWGVRAICLQADTADDDACRKMIEATVKQLGRLDILINNAATTRFVPHNDLEALTTELWDRIFAVNVRGAFQCTRAARPHLERSGQGNVINISSIAGLNGTGSSIPYCASKAALIVMTQSLARALAPKIRVNSVAPGFIETRWTQEGLGSNYAAMVDSIKQRVPLGKVCQPEDVAEAIVSLLIGSRMITGQTIVCDGGALLA
jgi:3-oxoacyl-[acyl-carrier protein] reductase